ncbi:MAG: efflux RND transporter periplasmic adaptor subunit [bacterium]|nr:efflux RND transporter periplasmic adaptor subunit [bacterium]
MKSFLCFFLLSIFFLSCRSKVEKVKPVFSAISESIYASGILKSKNQYEAFATVNGLIETIYVKEGDSVKKGEPILSIASEAQRLNKENAGLAAEFSDFNANQGKLNEAQLGIELARNKLKVDSALYYRSLNLWEQNIGTKVELEQRELSYQNSKNAYSSAKIRYWDLKRQLDFTSLQSKKNLLISSLVESDFTLKSEIDGVVYNLNKVKGEIVSMQTPLATLGDAKNFILEMQVDEYDIIKIKKDLPVLVVLDSYRGRVFEAKITRINPMMNERSKTFLVEAEFTDRPEVIYPNITFEANIVLTSKEKALLIPRNFMINDSMVLKGKDNMVKVKTGLKDYKMIEITEGLTADDELIKPAQ